MEDGKEPVYASKAKPWLKYYDEKYIHQSVPECSAFALVCRNNERHLGDTALEYYGRKFSYADLIVQIKKTAAALQALGVKKGDIIAELEGSTLTLLKGERTALNLLQHMSGIASATNRCVELVKGTNASVTDTRKTLPGLRALQKYSVTVGGGKNHRFNLSDAAMLKDNHIDAYGGITAAVSALREKIGHTVKIEVEVRTLDELREALENKVEIVMLDNMSCEEMAEAVKITDGRALLEASGNVTESNIRSVAETGVDIISLGALTHSVKCFDVSMKIKK